MQSPSQAEPSLVPRPRITGASVYALTGLFVAAFVWAYLVEVDIAVRAPGLVRPQGNVVRLTSELGGVVDSVHAVEGDFMSAGDSLLRLRDPENETEIETVEEQMRLLSGGIHDVGRRLESRAEVYRLEALKLDSEIEAARQDLERRRAEHEAMRNSAAVRLAEALSETQTSQSLLDAGLISRRAHEGALNDLRLAEAAGQEVEARKPSDAALRALVESAGLLRAVLESDQRNLQSEATPLRSELARLRLEQVKSQLQRQKQSILSPADGRITYLSPIHPGEYLAPGTLVATLAPRDSIIVVEALVSNREVENVRPGQAVRLVSGESIRIGGSVLSVGPDALADDTSSGAYRIVIAPESTDLRLGMALEVRLITHTERLLSLLFRRITRSVEDWAGS